MTNRSNNDIAKALEGLASGDPAGPEGAAGEALPPARPVHPARALTPERVARPSSPAGPPPGPSPVMAPPAPFVVSDDAPPGMDEDDAVIVPAPPPEYLAHAPHHAPATSSAAAVAAGARSVRFRQTVIPVLLTTGLLMLTATVLRYTVHPDAPLAAMPGWLAGVLAAAGVALLTVAGLNAIQARR